MSRSQTRIESVATEQVTGADPDLILITSSADGVAGDGTSYAEVRGNFAYITSDARNLVSGDTNIGYDIFVKNLTTGAITEITEQSAEQTVHSASFCDVSNDGNGILYFGFYGDYGLFLKDLTTGLVRQVDTSATGVSSVDGAVSAHFMHDQTKVLVTTFGDMGLGAGYRNIYIKDLTTGAVTAVSSSSKGVIGNYYCSDLGFSADDSKVYLWSSATNLVAKDTNRANDIFMKDLTTGVMTRLSTTSSGAQLNGSSAANYISHDDSTLIFTTTATNLDAGLCNIFSKNIITGLVTPIATNSAGELGNSKVSGVLAVGDDGKTVLFYSQATNLVEGDTNGAPDVFIKDMVTGTTTRIFSTDPYRSRDSTSYRAQYADNGSKIILTVERGNDNDEHTAWQDGGASIYTSTIYLIDLVAHTTTTLTSGAQGMIYQPGGVAIARYVDWLTLAGISPDGDHLVLNEVQNGVPLIPVNVTNVYMAPLNTTSLQDNIGNSHDNVLTGGRGVNDMFGRDGNDILIGNADNDRMDGGAGIDAASYSRSAHGVQVDLTQQSVLQDTGGAGQDILISIENLTGSNFADTLLGDDTTNTLLGGLGDDRLAAGGGNDRLDGGTGDDQLSGGLGNDMYIVDSLNDLVTEGVGAGSDTIVTHLTYSLGDNIENLTLTGTADINGTGNGLANVLTGNTGHNILRGGFGDDTYVTDGNDTIGENAYEGTDTVRSSVTYSLGSYLENLTLTSSGNINGTGNALNNILTGNTRNNVLDGAAGADTMAGGRGNDTYIVDNAGDVVQEGVNAGTDTVRASVTYSLAGGLSERLILTGAGNTNGTGNSLDNRLVGNSGDNVLNGGYGADVMRGHEGDDSYYVDNAGDDVIETTGEGSDIVYSSITYSLADRFVENMTLIGPDAADATGNSLANVISGNKAANVLNGGYGADTLTGGLGADTFLFGTASGLDTITDFSASQGDTINVHAYLARATALISQVGGDVQIHLGGSNVITVTGASVADVSAHMVW